MTKKIYLIGKIKDVRIIKDTKFYKNYGNNYRVNKGSQFKNNKQQNATTIKEREVPIAYNKYTTQREPLKC